MNSLQIYLDYRGDCASVRPPLQHPLLRRVYLLQRLPLAPAVSIVPTNSPAIETMPCAPQYFLFIIAIAVQNGRDSVKVARETGRSYQAKETQAWRMRGVAL